MQINGFDRTIEIFNGYGTEKVKMFRGNFDIKDKKVKRLNSEEGITIKTELKDGLIYVYGKADNKTINRTWIRISADASEHVVGGGEQFSYLDLRKRVYPVWTREQGVGRNKHTLVTRLADAEHAGGDYYTTFYPQATFTVSGKKNRQLYFFNLFNTEYSTLDFTNDSYHEICVWSGEFSFAIGTGKDYEEILFKMTSLLGRQKSLPDWAIRGIWLGVQGGTQRALDCLKKCEDAGMDVPVVWIQDWVGKRVTSFGKRLQWDWRWNSQHYPALDEVIKNSNERWMGYINPYLVEGGVLFNEAKSNGYFVKNSEGQDYLFDFGEYNCAVVDLTMPKAFNWYKEVIQKNMIDLGFKGWMADFGEYLPYDAVCYGGSGAVCHNQWPVLWAKCNREAVDERKATGDCIFFMRAGGAYSGKYSTLTWAGDQNVDFSVDDGLPSVITAALSVGMSGFGLHSCDCGGYTTLFHLKRTPELFKRWLEYSCFTPVMRTHEGNRPDVNVQLYSDEDIMGCATYWVKVHNALAPYIKECMKINEERGIPVQRPLFLQERFNDKFYDRNLFEFMLGEDLLVAPVVKKGAVKRAVELPKGKWINIWTGKEYKEGRHLVSAPIGKIPVFFRKNSVNSDLFSKIREI